MEATAMEATAIHRKIQTTALYAIGHFAVDFSCAALLFSRVSGTQGWVLATLVYNFCAFALQMPLGLLTDGLNKNRMVAACGCALVMLAFLPMPALLVSAVAGVGNALYHVGGGVDVLNLSEGKAGLLGVYVSPGALGIFLGSLLGKSGAVPAIAPLLLTGACGAAVLLWCRAPKNAPVSLIGAKGVWTAALCLFLVVVLRSYTGFLFTFPWKTGLWAVLFVCSVVLGKSFGGFLADRFGTGPAATGSLVLAAILFLFSQHAVCGVLAVCLFNMTMPLTLRLAADAFPGAKGFSFGLLTFALFLGFVPTWLGRMPQGSGGLYAVLCLLSLTLLVPALKKRKTQ